LKTCPDEEGIKTCSGIDEIPFPALKTCPDEEGIKTRPKSYTDDITNFENLP